MTNQTYIAAKAAYGGEAQSPMIAKLLEDLLGTDLRAPGFPGPAGMSGLQVAGTGAVASLDRAAGRRHDCDRRPP